MYGFTDKLERLVNPNEPFPLISFVPYHRQFYGFQISHNKSALKQKPLERGFLKNDVSILETV